MSVHFRHYDGKPLYTPEYLKVRDFLVHINRGHLVSPNFTWGRWEWMIGHSMLDTSHLDRIGLWENDGVLIGLATYESELGYGFFCLDERYPQLKAEMFEYARTALAKDGSFTAVLDGSDREFQQIAVSKGYKPTDEHEHIAMIDIHQGLSYQLPDGFSITSMAEGWDWCKYHRCMWKGFNHEGEPVCSDENIRMRKQMLSGPSVDPSLVIAVVAPDGEYVSHCGMWHKPGDSYALVEPVATDPHYRRLGLGKAAVLEAVIRCGKRGAKTALVGSSQPFYMSIGFYPAYTATFWKMS